VSYRCTLFCHYVSCHTDKKAFFSAISGIFQGNQRKKSPYAIFHEFSCFVTYAKIGLFLDVFVVDGDIAEYNKK
jgi:hypothetical protein